jgi:hypothetical protein
MDGNALIPYIGIVGAFVAGLLAGLRFSAIKARKSEELYKKQVEEIDRERIAQKESIGKEIIKNASKSDFIGLANLASQLLSRYPVSRN